MTQARQDALWILLGVGLAVVGVGGWDGGWKGMTEALLGALLLGLAVRALTRESR
jgi:hypothetical protein